MSEPSTFTSLVNGTIGGGTAGTGPSITASTALSGINSGDWNGLWTRLSIAPASQLTSDPVRGEFACTELNVLSKIRNCWHWTGDSSPIRSAAVSVAFVADEVVGDSLGPSAAGSKAAVAVSFALMSSALASAA